jgi:hypothetical protein
MSKTHKRKAAHRFATRAHMRTTHLMLFDAPRYAASRHNSLV